MNWIDATLIESKLITPHFKALRFQVHQPVFYKAGQYYALRVVSGQGHIAERHYSLANPFEAGVIEFGVQYIDGGQLSPYLHSMKKGETIQIKGPLGNQFVWNSALSEPALFIVGGSGIVPIISMIRTAEREQTARPMSLLASFRSDEDILYKQLLQKWKKQKLISVDLTLTRETKHQYEFSRRIDTVMLREFVGENRADLEIYVSGSTSFVESITQMLLEVGVALHQIKSERFG